MSFDSRRTPAAFALKFDTLSLRPEHFSINDFGHLRYFVTCIELIGIENDFNPVHHEIKHKKTAPDISIPDTAAMIQFLLFIYNKFISIPDTCP